MQKKVIALGFFDGVHRGHGALLECTVRRAKELGATPAVFTFDRSPKEVVTGIPCPLLSSCEDRRELIARYYGIETVLFAPFDTAMMTLSWERFVEDLLVGQEDAVHVVAGHDFRFGHRNAGNPQLLREKCAQLGIGCDIIPKVEQDGRTVSSTYIRQLVAEGRMEEANRFLGHPHTLRQTVRHGQRLGRTIGVPTINLELPAQILVPRHGVYITRTTLPDGRTQAGITNVGLRPTVGAFQQPTIETFLLDFSGDLYAQSVRVEFFHRLRDERRFETMDALREQIERDAAQARAYFAKQK